jgi:sporulation protein YlmC with PRC-barrel domain
MLLTASQISTLPIISLQTGEAVAMTRQPILAIATLEIMALRCESAHGKAPLLLMARDIRQFAADCVIVDDEDELADPQDIVRLNAILEASYDPLGKAVVSDAGRKLGSVEDYTFNLETNRVQQLQVRQSLIKAWLGTSLMVDRSQIIDITPRQIMVRDATVKAPVMQSEPIPESSP